jgi:hypothetical protein
MALWNEFKVNNILDIKDTDEHFLHLPFQHASSLSTIYATQKLLDFFIGSLP